MNVSNQELQCAMKLASKYNSSFSLGVPIDLEKIAGDLGVTSIEPREMAAEGYLGVGKDDELVIRYRSDRSHVRTRFTIAHEIGHILLALAQGKSICEEVYRSDDESSDEEIAVNKIAAELLMPELSVRWLLANRPVSWNQVHRICRVFDVSVSAATRRILDLNCVPAVWMSLRVENENKLKSWKLRASKNPPVNFLEPVDRLARAVFENALNRRVSEITIHTPEKTISMPMVSRLMNAYGSTEFWCVSWSTPC